MTRMNRVERNKRLVALSLEAWSLRAEGLKFREIGEHFGFTGSRAYQLVNYAAHLINGNLRRRAKFCMETNHDDKKLREDDTRHP